MQYYIAVIGYNKGVAIHAEFVRQRKFADIVNRHVCAGHTEQCVIRRICHVVALTIKHRCAHGSQQPVFLPGCGVQGG